VLRQARAAGWFGTGGRGSHYRGFCQGIAGGSGGRAIRRGRGISGGIKSGHEEFQLGGIHLLALSPENPLHQSVDLLPEEFDFLFQLRDLPLAGGERSGQFGFKWSHA